MAHGQRSMGGNSLREGRPSTAHSEANYLSTHIYAQAVLECLSPVAYCQGCIHHSMRKLCSADLASSTLVFRGRRVESQNCVGLRSAHLPSPAPMSTSLLVWSMPQLLERLCSTFCMPVRVNEPYRPSMPSPPPSLFCSTAVHLSLFC